MWWTTCRTDARARHQHRRLRTVVPHHRRQWLATAGGGRLQLRGLRPPPCGIADRGHGPQRVHPGGHPLELFGQQDRRRGAGPVLLSEVRHPGGGGAFLQHHRATPDRTLRHGRAAFRGTGGTRRADHGVRRRRADAFVLRCARQRARARHARFARGRRRAGGKRRQRPRDPRISKTSSGAGRT